MPNQNHFYFSIFFSILTHFAFVTSKSTIEPCSNSTPCNAMLGYTLYTDLKVSEVASLFQIDPISLLTSNAFDISYPDIENHILPSQLFLKIPITCSCVDGIRKSLDTRYKTRPSDTLSTIADSIYSGLVSADQIRDANSISDPSVLDVGLMLVVPLPCTCFNLTDNSLPAIYLSYVVTPVDTLTGIAARYLTTITDLMNVNAMGSSAIKAGDILAVPLPVPGEFHVIVLCKWCLGYNAESVLVGCAWWLSVSFVDIITACASKFRRYASDFGLIVPNGSYAITAGHCVQCSCGPGNLDLYCTPSSLAVSCSSMQCRNSNLMLGNITVQPSSAGCNVTSCAYGGSVNGTILNRLSVSLQPQCPGEHQFPPVVVPPSATTRYSLFAPSPSPSQSGSLGPTTPMSSVMPGTTSLPGFPPANGPIGSTSDSPSLVNPLSGFPSTIVVCLFIKFVVSMAL
ncbi:hypothetical protein HHK36_007805 [Tetracentron sinense]|uniref:LysM domain-containing protein n=1 Tax=Tetracentron sinense TaxID=13715 RepID=A0A834ZID8_TETSI|nr:hypothetical protein HHK36_007805 [Tetracentron sinense]